MSVKRSSTRPWRTSTGFWKMFGRIPCLLKRVALTGSSARWQKSLEQVTSKFLEKKKGPTSPRPGPAPLKLWSLISAHRKTNDRLWRPAFAEEQDGNISTILMPESQQRHTGSHTGCLSAVQLRSFSAPHQTQVLAIPEHSSLTGRGWSHHPRQAHPIFDPQPASASQETKGCEFGRNPLRLSSSIPLKTISGLRRRLLQIVGSRSTRSRFSRHSSSQLTQPSHLGKRVFAFHLAWHASRGEIQRDPNSFGRSYTWFYPYWLHPI